MNDDAPLPYGVPRKLWVGLAEHGIRGADPGVIGVSVPSRTIISSTMNRFIDLVDPNR